MIALNLPPEEKGPTTGADGGVGGGQHWRHRAGQGCTVNGIRNDSRRMRRGNVDFFIEDAEEMTTV